MGIDCLFLAGALESLVDHASSGVFGECFRRSYPRTGICFFVSGLIG